MSRVLRHAGGRQADGGRPRRARGVGAWVSASALGMCILAAPGFAAEVDLNLSSVGRALETIRGAALASHVRFLADDLLEGRGAGTRGYDLAARYVAAQFEALGLEPAGSVSSWFQPVPLRRTALVPGSSSLTLSRKGRVRTLRLERDYMMGGDPSRARSEVVAPVVFAGFGVTAPELGYDDFADLDVRGKIVAVLSGAPPTFPPDHRAHYSKGATKDENLVARGATGMITVRTPVDERRFAWDRAVRQGRMASMRWMDQGGRIVDAFPELRCSATLSRSGAEALFASSPRPLEEVFATAERGKPQGFDLRVEARMSRKSRLADLSSPNVAGLMRGSDPKLRDEVVVYTAHLDHLGIGTPVAGDSIYNGAFDNATGVASIVEVARAFASMPRKPRRSVLFLAVTGEEKGLLGSDYFAQYPTVPAERIVANVNLDMFVMVHPLRDVIAYGAEHSTLGDVVSQATRRLGLRLSPDPAPEEVIFVRSDQYSFVRRGIPAVFLVGGSDDGDPEAPGDSLKVRWRRTIYHSPQDDLSQPLDLPSFEAFTRTGFLIGHIVSNQARRPEWKPGDFFGELFGQGRAATKP